MTLIASISGVRGTLGGRPGEGLTPNDVLCYVAAFGHVLLQQDIRKKRVVIGRDARPSGVWCSQLVGAVLQAMGFEVVDIGLTTTPTTQMEVVAEEACGGVVITASHNSISWNALKFLHETGEFVSPAMAKTIATLAVQPNTFTYADHAGQGCIRLKKDAINRHIEAILALPLVDVAAIRARKFKVAIDAVGSTGGISLIPLLEALGVAQIVPLHCTPTGYFPHVPEPLPEHIGELCACVRQQGLDVGLAVDPDVDRLALVAEDGQPFGEEYTLVAVADYVLSRTPGACVSNLSSSRALQDIAKKYGQMYHATAVGEIHVVEKMRACNAIIGGEGNGGIIYPTLHAGRDALVGAALFLSHLARRKCSVTALRATYPRYYMCKSKLALPNRTDVSTHLQTISQQYSTYQQHDADGLRIDLPEGWIHMRPSNTEPVLRLYAEANSQAAAQALTERFMQFFHTS